MNKQDYYIIGGAILAIGLIYYFFMYKPKPKATNNNTNRNNTTQQQQTYTGDIAGDLSTIASNAGELDSGFSGDITAGR